MLQNNVSERIDLGVDLDAVLPCEGVLYSDGPLDEDWQDTCSNPAEWSRPGHCLPDRNYCDPCKEQITSWARHGWVKCAICGATIWVEGLRWYRV